MLGLRKEADGSPSPPPEINEMGKHILRLAVYILCMYYVIDDLAFTFGFCQISSPPVCICDQDFLNNISECNYLELYILQHTYIDNDMMLIMYFYISDQVAHTELLV